MTGTLTERDILTTNAVSVDVSTIRTSQTAHRSCDLSGLAGRREAAAPQVAESHSMLTDAKIPDSVRNWLDKSQYGCWADQEPAGRNALFISTQTADGPTVEWLVEPDPEDHAK